MSTAEIVGKNIRNLREKQGLNQTDLAVILGVTDKAISTWERGKSSPRLKTTQKLAEYFNIEVAQLYVDLDDVKPKEKEVKEINDISDRERILRIFDSVNILGKQIILDKTKEVISNKMFWED